MRRRQLTLIPAAAALAVMLSVGAGPLPAAAENSAAGAGPVVTPTASPPGADVAPEPGSATDRRFTSPACAGPATGRQACVEITRPRAGAPRPGDVSTLAILPIPQWCTNSGVWGLRTEACENFGVTYTTYVVSSSGVRTVTGQVQFNAYSYSYSSVDLGTWGHQFSIASYTGWGDALRASVSGSARASGSCTRSSSSFPPQPVTPTFTMRSGEAYFNTTATGLGAVGFCTTTWDVTFTNAGYTPAGISRSLDETRCDNATGANLQRPARVGCVVYWYASAVYYSQSRYPSLASHVSRAQASGLPGNSFAAPLTRTTNQTIITTNRTRACGNAPTITGKSCDEYPLATTNQGLAAGGSLRTFDGCNINAPRATGPTGASACMITATENNAQGALMAAFNYDWRVLNNDPFRVLISA